MLTHFPLMLVLSLLVHISSINHCGPPSAAPFIGLCSSTKLPVSPYAGPHSCVVPEAGSRGYPFGTATVCENPPSLEAAAADTATELLSTCMA